LLDLLLLFVQMCVHAVRRIDKLRRRHGVWAKLRRPAVALGAAGRADSSFGSYRNSTAASFAASPGSHCGPCAGTSSDDALVVARDASGGAAD